MLTALAMETATSAITVNVKGTIPEVTAASAAMGSIAPMKSRICDQRSGMSMSCRGNLSYRSTYRRAANIGTLTSTMRPRSFAVIRLPRL